MRVLADVHVKSAYCNALRSHGHEVVRVQDVLDQAATDESIIEYAREARLVVLTNDDKDFGQFGSHHGVLFVPQDMQPGTVETAVSRIERQFDGLDDTVQYVRDWA
jgi:predicted nuclease of predicted toxin-antitoxin system